MQVTLDLDESLVEQARTIAAISNRTLKVVIEDVLREALARMAMPKKDVKLPVSRARGGLMPGVDLDNGVQLRDILDAYSPFVKLL